jgi:hypothetical protein
MDNTKLFNPGAKAIVRVVEPVAAEPVAEATAIPILSAEVFAKEALRRGFTLAPISEITQTNEPTVETESERRERVASYERADLPPRTPQEISQLLRFESPEETQLRIRNDQSRSLNRRQGRNINPNSTVVDPSSGSDGIASWVQR